MAADSPSDSPHRRPLDDDAPSRAAYHAVAEVADCDPLELPPLGRSIDTEALDRLVTPGDADALSGTFEYAGYAVTITGTAVEVRPLNA